MVEIKSGPSKEELVEVLFCESFCPPELTFDLHNAQLKDGGIKVFISIKSIGRLWKREDDGYLMFTIQGIWRRADEGHFSERKRFTADYDPISKTGVFRPTTLPA